MNKLTTLTSIAAATLLFGGTASAEAPQGPAGQQEQDRPQQTTQTGDQEKKAAQKQKQTQARMETPTRADAERMTNIQGTIAAKKTVQIKGQKGKGNQVVLLEMQDGRRVIADLGPSDRLAKMNLEKGTKIQVTGQPARVGNRLVLFADQVGLGGETHAIQRSSAEMGLRARQEQQGKGQTTAQAQAGTQNLKGKIIRQKDVKFKGEGQEKMSNKVVLLRTDEGATYAVDLGPSQSLTDIDLKTGTPIEVKGTLVEVGDRLVMMAKEIDVGEKNVDIRRPEQMRQARR